jgi:hypothetical protein
LPNHLPDLRRKPIEPSPQTDRTAGKEDLRPRRQVDHVEVTEDEELIRMFVYQVLIDADFEVVEIGRADDAVVVLRATAHEIHACSRTYICRAQSTAWHWLACRSGPGRGLRCCSLRGKRTPRR